MAADGRDGKKGKDEKDGRPESHPSHSSHYTPSGVRIIPPRGDPRTLLSYQKSEVVYDLAFRFARKFLPKGDRTIDQMIQAARSGKANILRLEKDFLEQDGLRERMTRARLHRRNHPDSP